LEETVEFAEAVSGATEITDEQDTLIVVTAGTKKIKFCCHHFAIISFLILVTDHAHTLTLAGYNQRGKDILGLNSEISDIDSLPYSTLSYANGPSYKPRYRMQNSEMGKLMTLAAVDDFA